jgi:hypothetical protein
MGMVLSKQARPDQQSELEQRYRTSMLHQTWPQEEAGVDPAPALR